MSIQNYSNRNKYKNKSAIEIVFKKSSDFQIPKGYTSMDICLVSGGAAGFGFNLVSLSGNPRNVYGQAHYGLGGSGGYVRNLYNKKINAKNIYVEVGEGGISGTTTSHGYLQPKYPYFNCSVIEHKNYYDPITGKTYPKYKTFGTFNYKKVGGGGKTFIKDKDTNKILFECLAPEGWGIKKIVTDSTHGYIARPNMNNPGTTYAIYNIMPLGGGNLGGCSLYYLERTISTAYSDPVFATYEVGSEYDYYISKYVKKTPQIYPEGATKGEPSFVSFDKIEKIKGTEAIILSETNDNYIFHAGYPGETKEIILTIAAGNRAITEEGYDDTRIFDGSSKIFNGKGYCEGDWVAGGGCAGYLGKEGETPYITRTDRDGIVHYEVIPPTIVKDEKTYLLTNPDGGGQSGVAKCTNSPSYIGESIWYGKAYELISAPGNGKPNTGGGGAGGMYYIASNSAKHVPGAPTNGYNFYYTGEKLALAGNGGSGICVIRLYSDENRPKVTFVEGINRTIIE